MHVNLLIINIYKDRNWYNESVSPTIFVLTCDLSLLLPPEFSLFRCLFLFLHLPGRAIGARILLGDRDVDITLSRLATAVSDSKSER